MYTIQFRSDFIYRDVTPLEVSLSVQEPNVCRLALGVTQQRADVRHDLDAAGSGWWGRGKRFDSHEGRRRMTGSRDVVERNYNLYDSTSRRALMARKSFSASGSVMFSSLTSHGRRAWKRKNAMVR